jgi:hypothetical protein
MLSKAERDELQRLCNEQEIDAFGRKTVLQLLDDLDAKDAELKEATGDLRGVTKSRDHYLAEFQSSTEREQRLRDKVAECRAVLLQETFLTDSWPCIENIQHIAANDCGHFGSGLVKRARSIISALADAPAAQPSEAERPKESAGLAGMLVSEEVERLKGALADIREATDERYRPWTSAEQEYAERLSWVRVILDREYA